MAEGKILIAVNPSWTETEVLSFIITVWPDGLLSHIIATLEDFELQVAVLLSECGLRPGICILARLSRES